MAKRGDSPSKVGPSKVGPSKVGPPEVSADDKRIWARVTGTVKPPRTRKAARVTPGVAETPPVLSVVTPSPPRPRVARPEPALPGPQAAAPVVARRPVSAPDELEPRRQRRLSRERDPIEATIDLHGFGRFDAEDQLRAFLGGCQARGMRAVLVITGQGRRGGGVIRASVHEWLHATALRGVVSGFATAHRRHGGDGAIYVTLKRRD
ncbi:MAG: DNA mismatch repair protein MutS [Brevundimonas sp.]|uniref:Smr/MutS family protein n=1 Tax=Brevundimonas sp. TaxID=1871086 RepID=UPI00121CB876|nr:Smr/MutS family protein [Brevundimonas sp.]RZJ17182.1 MAG: DNA mismatch repair protein MutS [Brevundimonas sp.]